MGFGNSTAWKFIEDGISSMLTAPFKSVSLLLVLLSGQKEKRVAALPLKILTL